MYFNNYIKEILEVVNTQDFPDFSFGDGSFYIDSKEPIIVEDSDVGEKNFIFIIDTSGQATVNDVINYNTGYLLTETTLIMATSGQTNYIDLDTIGWYHISKDELVTSLELTSGLGVVLYAIGSILLAFFTTLFRCLVLLLLANILKRLLQLNNLKGSMLFNMVLYSSTVGIIMYQLASILPQIFPATIIGEVFFAAGSVIFFYIPASTILSRSLKYLKLHEELQKLHVMVENKKEAELKKQSLRPKVHQRRDDKEDNSVTNKEFEQDSEQDSDSNSHK